MTHTRSQSEPITSIGQIYDTFEREQEGLVNRFQREIRKLNDHRMIEPPRDRHPVFMPRHTTSIDIVSAHLRLQHENERLQLENASLINRLRHLESLLKQEKQF